jgi:kynurenine formamidase
MTATLISDFAIAIASGAVRVVDLTQPLEAATPILGLPPQFGTSWPFSLEQISKYDDQGSAWYWNNMSCGEHTGTHFDAPVHWVTGKDLPNNTTDTISAQKFIAPACVIDMTKRVASDPDYLVTIADIEAWEGEHGRIPSGSWALLRSGWSKRKDPKDFLNAGEDGPHTPGPHPDLPLFLAKERDAIGFGTETVGTDAGQSFAFDTPFPCHHNMHGAGKFGLPSLCNLDLLPPTGAVIIAAPLKIVNGSGSPVRVLALVPG